MFLRRHRLVLPLVLAAAFLIGCRQSESTAAEPPATNLPTAAQPKLPTTKLFIGAKEVEAEVAMTETQIRTGMMFRTNITDTEGMLFIFGAPHQPSFWMKNVPINLAIAYLDAAGTIREIHPLIANVEAPVLARRSDIQFVLEMREGWFERNNVGVGTVIRTPRGSLQQTFIQRR
jgi:hypothetical protein